IGRGEVLQRACVDFVTEVKGVGENLQDHLQLLLVYKVTGVPTLNENATKAARRSCASTVLKEQLCHDRAA
ncbi:hypothetical protein AB9F41_36030, partial [Rhizobium leguminosarum]|uniref:hypothetical protein n=1 Tax=Rhizobium leguminosarum TaxID=384 RepID=UPI003F995B65